IVGTLLVFFLFRSDTIRENDLDELDMEEQNQHASHHSPYGFSLEYPKVAYTIVSQQEAVGGDLVSAHAIYQADEYEQLTQSAVPGEAPVSLTMEVFRNPMNLSVAEWIEQNERSNFHLSVTGEIQTAHLGVTEFATYQYDGLYRSDAYVYAQ